jgi:hypothetical protein
MLQDRKVAAHEVDIEGNIESMHVVVLRNGYVIEISPLNGEPENTEWLGGKIEIKKDEKGLLVAFKNNRRIE